MQPTLYRLARLTRLAAVAGALSLGPVGAGALAQAPEPTPPMPPAQGGAPIDEAQLQAFAEATVEINRISDTYGPQIEAAQSNEDAQALQEQAQAEMIQTVEEKGLTVDEYNAIFATAQADPQVAATIQDMIARLN